MSISTVHRVPPEPGLAAPELWATGAQAGPMWQTQLAIPLTGRISRQFAPDFVWARGPLHYHARPPRTLERWDKITRKHAVGMGN